MTCAISTALLSAVLAFAPFGLAATTAGAASAGSTKKDASCPVSPEECKKHCPEGAASKNASSCPLPPDECAKVCPGGGKHTVKAPVASPKRNAPPVRS